MTTVNVRELGRNTSKVLDDAARRRRGTVVTRAGRPIAVVIPINTDAFEDWVLANAPEFVQGRKLADEQARRGDTISFEDLLALERPAAKRRARARR